MLNLVERSAEMNDYARLVGLQETYAPAAVALLLTSMIRISLPHLGPTVLTNGRVRTHEPYYDKFVYTLHKGQHLSSDYKSDQPIELTNPSGGELCFRSCPPGTTKAEPPPLPSPLASGLHSQA